MGYKFAMDEGKLGTRNILHNHEILTSFLWIVFFMYFFIIFIIYFIILETWGWLDGRIYAHTTGLAKYCHLNFISRFHSIILKGLTRKVSDKTGAQQ